MLACEFAVLGNCYGHTSEKECILVMYRNVYFTALFFQNETGLNS